MATSLPTVASSTTAKQPLFQFSAATYRSLAGKAPKQAQTLIDFEGLTETVTRIPVQPGKSYRLTDPVTGKVIEPKKLQQVQRALEITLQDGRQVVLDDFFTTVLNAEGTPLLQAQAEFVFFTGSETTPYWMVDPLANLAEWPLESVTQIWPSQELLGIPRWMNAQGLMGSALIVPPVGALVVEATLGSGLLGALGGLGLLAGAGGGGGNKAVPVEPTPPLNSTNRIFSENIPLSTVVFSTTAKPDPSSLSVVYSLKDSDFAKFSINPSTGDVKFLANPDADLPGDIGGDNVYNFTVVATDSLKRTTSQAVSVTVLDLADQGPAFKNGNLPEARSTAENSAADMVVFDGSAKPDIVGATITYKLSGADALKFRVDATGQVRFIVSPDHEVPGDLGAGVSVAGNNVYDLVITATKAGGLSSEKKLTVTVTDVLDVSPVFTSANSVNVNENFLTTESVIAVKATPDIAGNTIRYTLGGVDAARFTIDASTGQVKFVAKPDFEAPLDTGRNNDYDLIVTATETLNGVTTSSTQALVVSVADVRDILGFSSLSSFTTDENSTNTGYTAKAVVDSPTATYTYTLGAGGDSSLFNINANTGVLTFKNAPDFENPADAGANNVYNVQVVATTTGLATNQTATQNVDITVRDVVGVQPIPVSSLNGVTTLDVQSDLVINFASAINLTTNSATKLRVVSTSSARSFAIDLTDATQVTLSADGKSLVINPKGDLDFGTSYHIEVDAGAFISRADPTGTLASSAHNNLATFTTVAASRAGTVSQKMTGSGSLAASQTYMDISGVGDVNTVDKSIDMSLGNITLVYVDGNAAGGTPNTTGIGTGATGFNLQVKNWAFGDFLYFDDRTSGPNSLSNNLTDSFGGLQDGNVFNNSANNATQVLNFVGMLQIDPGGPGLNQSWIGFGVATPGYGGLDGAAFKNSVISA